MGHSRLEPTWGVARLALKGNLQASWPLAIAFDQRPEGCPSLPGRFGKFTVVFGPAVCSVTLLIFGRLEFVGSGQTSFGR